MLRAYNLHDHCRTFVIMGIAIRIFMRSTPTDVDLPSRAILIYQKHQIYYTELQDSSFSQVKIVICNCVFRIIPFDAFNQFNHFNRSTGRYDERN